jgi:hypothetical protein
MIIRLKKCYNDLDHHYDWYEACKRVNDEWIPIPIVGSDIDIMKWRVSKLYPDEQNIKFIIADEAK